MGRRPICSDPVCANCACSLAGPDLDRLKCPECGHVYYPPPLPPLTLNWREARAHVVCTINGALCLLVALALGGRNTDLYGAIGFDWGTGAAVAAASNLVLFIFLIALFPRRSADWQLVMTAVLCMLPFFSVALVSIR